MTESDYAERYCALIEVVWKRMEKGAAMAFSQNPRQQVACKRMLHYTRMGRWLVQRAIRADPVVVAEWQQKQNGTTPLTWPRSGITAQDISHWQYVAAKEPQGVIGELLAITTALFPVAERTGQSLVPKEGA